MLNRPPSVWYRKPTAVQPLEWACFRDAVCVRYRLTFGVRPLHLQTPGLDGQAIFVSNSYLGENINFTETPPMNLSLPSRKMHSMQPEELLGRTLSQCMVIGTVPKMATSRL